MNFSITYTDHYWLDWNNEKEMDAFSRKIMDNELAMDWNMKYGNMTNIRYDHMYVGTPITYAFFKQILTGYNVSNNLTFVDFMDNFQLFEFNLVILLAVAIVFFIIICDYEHENTLVHIWNFVKYILQRIPLNFPESKIVRLSYIMYVFLAIVISLNHFKTEMVVNDSIQPVSTLEDFLDQEHASLRPMFLAWDLDSVYQYKKYLKIHSTNYNKLLLKGMAMDMEKSKIFTNPKSIDRTYRRIIKGEVAFVGEEPIIKFLRKFGCSKMKADQIKNVIVWASVEKFDVIQKFYLMKKGIDPSKRRTIENM